MTLQLYVGINLILGIFVTGTAVCRHLLDSIWTSLTLQLFC